MADTSQALRDPNEAAMNVNKRYVAAQVAGSLAAALVLPDMSADEAILIYREVYQRLQETGGPFASS